jgi:hypothetical protein
MTMAIANCWTDQKAERIRDFQIALDLKVCTANRNIMDCAIDIRALERDRPGHSNFLALVISTIHRHDSFFGSKLPDVRAALRTVASWLLQGIVDRAEHVVQVRADAIDHSKNDNRNARSDQPIFDRGGTGLIGYKFRNNSFQMRLQLLRRICEERMLSKPTRPGES